MLAKVPDLRVPARTSSFYFKGKPTKIPDIAKELGVGRAECPIICTESALCSAARSLLYHGQTSA